jgi:phosphoadenosine phosphosulfate reductase
VQLPLHPSKSASPAERGAPAPSRTPQEVISWAFARFSHRRLVVTTAFGMEGCALIDMIASFGIATEITYLDTHFLFPETLELRDRLARRYPRLAFVNRGTTMTPDQQALLHGDGLWLSDPDRCCGIRKIEPMRAVLSGADAWMTAIRRDQSETRAHIETIVWDTSFELVKISPLIAWSRADVYEYVLSHGVPISPLHERGYPTFGCTHCTRPVNGAGPADYSREGRWAGLGKTECGLHVDPATGALTRTRATEMNAATQADADGEGKKR